MLVGIVHFRRSEHFMHHGVCNNYTTSKLSLRSASPQQVPRGLVRSDCSRSHARLAALASASGKHFLYAGFGHIFRRLTSHTRSCVGSVNNCGFMFNLQSLARHPASCR